MSWGTSSWGLSPWGAGGAAISIAGAFASTTHTVRVTLSSEPAHLDGLDAGDALNPQTWTVSRLDTNVFFTVLAVAPTQPPLTYDLLLLEPLGNYLVTHRVQSTVLQSAGGVVISAPNFFDFLGVIEEDDAKPNPSSASGRSFVARDLANPPIPKSADGVLGGTLIVTAAGDYALEQGKDLLKKLVLRRLVTPRGAFFHLPNYGIGLAVKEPIPASNILALKKEIERQVKLEPDVEAVSASLSLDDATGTLTLILLVKQRSTGESVEIGLRSGPSGTVSL